jgi:ABC-2 type transport system ATP-binding protein
VIDATRLILFENVSKFYGEVLGVNRVTLAIPPGITSLVGPNGSGKTTLMNLATGLLSPTRGRVRVLGISPSDPEALFRLVGYCAQFDSFPAGATGQEFVASFLTLHGHSRVRARELALEALTRVNLVEAKDRRVAGYSKGMRQRVRLAQALAHGPRVLFLDEPLNGLDPMARAESIALFRQLADHGLHVVISSHILHEVDLISDRVILLKGGYVVAEGDIHGVRTEVSAQPMQVLVRCDRPSLLAARVFERDSAVEVQIHEDGLGLHVRTKDADGLYLLLNRIVEEDGLAVEMVSPADDDVQAVYRYLIEGEGESP